MAAASIGAGPLITSRASITSAAVAYIAADTLTVAAAIRGT